MYTFIMDMLFDDFKLSNSIGHIVNIVANKLRFELEQRFKTNGHDITAQQWMVLSIIYENMGMSQNELALKSKKDKTNVARILEKLENKNLVERIRSNEDKRVISLFLTKVGKNTRVELSQLALETIELSTRNISNEERDRCINILKKIYVNIS